jgi:nitrate reductase assembly molybdenum cofactor insertion protein NarJ
MNWLSVMEKWLRRQLYGDHALSEERASKATHDLNNAVQKLDLITNRLRRSGDPWHEFVKAVRGCEGERLHGPNGREHPK